MKYSDPHIAGHGQAAGRAGIVPRNDTDSRESSIVNPQSSIPRVSSLRSRVCSSGAALVLALFIMFILFAISLTFFTVSRIEFQSSTNVANTVRADLLGSAANALAVNMLKKDAIDHPNVTSTDHAWATYFNGLWMAGKSWAFPNSGVYPPVPQVFYQARGGVPTVEDPNDRGHLIPTLYVPRFESAPVANPANYNLTANRFVVDRFYDNRTAADIIDQYGDVDNDGDGKRDSVWIPLARDFLINDEMDEVNVDFNLDDHEDKPTVGTARMPVLFYPGAFEIRNGAGAWFLTAPIQDPSGEYITLYNLNIPGLPSPLSTDPKQPVNDIPGGRYLVDSIDNDYDGIINYHIEYYARADGTDPTEDDLKLPLGKRILPRSTFEYFVSTGYTEINRKYLDPDLEFRICTTGEPFCELVGRAAILIRDEASKVNMNVAGAHYLDSISLAENGIAPAVLAASDTDVFADFWRPAVGFGASAGEYLTWVLPRTGQGRSLKFWNMLTGAPNGSMVLDKPLAVFPSFVYDVTLPGYGFVDDNANALLLAINGIDDNGNGLVDEGTNPGTYLTPDEMDAAFAYARRAGWFTAPETSNLYVNPNASAADIAARVYQRFINQGVLEGVDEPGEFQYYRPQRNALAEGIADAPVGLFGDRALPNRDYIKRAILNEEVGSGTPGLAAAAVDRMRPFITTDSGAKNNRVLTDSNSADAGGPRLNFNYASAAQMARAFIEYWDLDEAADFDQSRAWHQQLGWRYTKEEIDNAITANDSLFPFNSFLAGMKMPGVNQSLAGAQDWLPGTPVNPYMPADPRLDAMLLAVNIADSADADHARTELSTAQMQDMDFDPWWYALQIANGETTDTAEKRPINYTVAGAEAIRINEIMVRPVRRIEAEIDWFYEQAGKPFYFPDTPVDSAFRVQCYRLNEERRAIPGTTLEYEINAADLAAVWNLSMLTSASFPVGVIGDSAGLATTTQNINLDIYDGIDLDPNAPPLSLPNVIEYRFQPCEQLPPGRYYLTINTKDTEGNPVLNKTASANFKFVAKYVSDPGGPDALCINPNADPTDPAQSVISVDNTGHRILDDLVLNALGLGYVPDFDGAIFGYENQRDDSSTPSGWLFCSGDQPEGIPEAEPPAALGYRRNSQAHTITIPHYAATAGGQVYLHVAVYYDGDPADLPGGAFSINFFDFSQEPDHEWVEIENISGQPVDIGGWQLVVGGPDSEGNIVTADKVVMTVPAGYVLDPVPPYNRALLAVSAVSPTIPEDNSVVFNNNPFYWNGIGQVGTAGYLAATYVFADATTVDIDAGDTTVPLIPPRDGNAPGVDGRGVATGVSPFESPDAARRIIPLKIIGLNADLLPLETDEAVEKHIADWVLRGGVFPNYPEHDQMDNDYDDHLLFNPFIDDDGDGIDDDSFALDGIDYSMGDTVAYPLGYGVDESRPWMDDFPNVQPGAFTYLPFFLLFTLAPQVAVEESSPEWKDLLERRFFPGDNVFVSLYQGPSEEKRLVDRITYTERDVINRSIDDGILIPVDAENKLVRPTLHDPLGAFTTNYRTFWPDNSMGIDFYRSLERKYHPLYNGDRFGTVNRWQATDGNYDDWSHETVIDEVPSDGFLPKKFSGSPLDRNDAAWDPEDYANADALLRQLDLVQIRDKGFTSVGDFLSLPSFTLNKEYAVYGGLPLSANGVTGFQPVNRVRDLMEAAVIDAIHLTPGQAVRFTQIYPSAPTPAELAFTYSTPLTTEYPQAWRPFYLYEIAETGESETPPGLPDDGGHWLFNSPLALPAGVDAAALQERWPIRNRAVLLASENMPSDLNLYSKVRFEWGASAGLQDGAYDLYIDTGAALLNASPGALTAAGKAILRGIGENAGAAPRLNVTVYTDTNGNGFIETGNPVDNTVRSESVGAFKAKSPDSSGRIWCGTVGVSNTRLAIDIENQSPNFILNTFAGVVLTPRARTQGRINVNTAEARTYNDIGGATRRLNVLAGIPGIVQEYPAPSWGTGTFNVAVEVTAAPFDFGVMVRHTGRSYYLLRFQEDATRLYAVVDGSMTEIATSDFIIPSGEHAVSVDFGTGMMSCSADGTTLFGAAYTQPAGTVGLMSATPNAAFLNAEFRDELSQIIPLPFNRGWSGIGWTGTVRANGKVDYKYNGGSTISIFAGYDDWDANTPANKLERYTTPPVAIGVDPLGDRPPFIRAEWVERSRPDNGDGRYYKSVTDLLVAPLYANAITNDNSAAAEREAAWRLSRSANLLTTRSDIFEILVTVQSGVGEDTNTDGIINYRDPNEFTITAERKSRTVYERP